ncbi:ABC transporter permease [Gordonia sp. GONU]|uniref:Phospholipid/cholesterol/gamma-HCH transport system permease protein n=1 Tax=Gordonia westfalica TaxID=158898 RepID=A0A1H2KL75_9ACTN|nr:MULTISPECIES: ABC transporter permease [Gordonia]ASR01246.1 putative phospholipid ABC transporter permease protein MlaE [Gordonia rubripertincta]MCR8898620.1 ABC transporter permease [Gordonia sp. GONU]SDU69352.1 phospholipid/cholesterol/gamma-HCH transport system permease protein [Gordonia westfalica]
MASPTKYSVSPTLSRTGRWLATSVFTVQEGIGRWALFTLQTVVNIPFTIRHYRKQTFKTMNSMAWGRGSIIVDGGVISLLMILGVAIGVAVAIEAYNTLNLIGFGPLTGVIGAFLNIREMGPIMTGIGFAAQVGCRMTAEIGSMRIAEEIDATETLGIRSIPFVVGTRLVGGMLCVIPGYLLSLAIGFLTASVFVKVVHGAPAGTYDHYFSQFLDPVEVMYSLIKAVTFCAVITIIHCYYGFFASGGPEGVGRASGRAIRASLVMTIVLNLVMTIVLWGLHPDLIFKG